MNYVNKHIKNINESILMDALPSDIVTKIITNDTSIGNNPAIPDIFDVPFLSKILNKRLEVEVPSSIYEELKSKKKSQTLSRSGFLAPPTGLEPVTS